MDGDIDMMAYTAGLNKQLWYYEKNTAVATSVYQINSNSIKFYPNPSSEVLNIQGEYKQYVITNIQGQTVHSGNSQTSFKLTNYKKEYICLR